MRKVIAIIVLLSLYASYRATLPRGLRLNNPLNIRENARVDYDWEGEASTDIDSEFEEFISIEKGIRAGTRILRSYAKRGITRLADIIGTWAPPSENDVPAYIKTITERTGFRLNKQITPHDYIVLLEAMAYHEQGRPISIVAITEGVRQGLI